MDTVTAPGLAALVQTYVLLAGVVLVVLAVFALADAAVRRVEAWWHMRRVRRDVARRERQVRVACRWRRVS